MEFVTFVQRRLLLAVLALGLCLLAVLAWINHPPKVLYANDYKTGVLFALRALTGQGNIADLAQDVVGFRALWHGENAYPVLSPVLWNELRLYWPEMDFRSPHPPTAYLLVAPIAFLSWPDALRAWSIATLIGALLCLMLLELRGWWLLCAFAMILLWPPFFWSVGQLTVVWMLGFCVAYRFRDRLPLLSGAGAALAAVTKITPVVLILPYLLRRNWKAMIGFATLGVLLLCMLLALHPPVLAEYMDVTLHGVSENVNRFDNGSLLAVMRAALGPLGVLLSLAFLGLIVVVRVPGFQADDALLWMLAGYLSVALLPIAWGYSLVPLIPVMIYLARSRRLVPILVAAVAYALPFLGTVGSEVSAHTTAATIVFVGLGLLTMRVPDIGPAF